MRTAFLTLTLILCFTLTPARAQVEGIAAVVNEDVITFSDLNQRLHLVAVSSGLKLDDETVKRLTPQVLSDLIDEQLRLQEAARLDLEVSDQNVQKGFLQLAAQNKLTLEEFNKSLVANKISVPSMERQLRAQIAWNLVAQTLLRPQVSISDTDVDDVLTRIKRSIGKEEYLASEIFLAVENPKEEANMRQLANRLIAQMKEKRAPFSRVAQQFSKAAGAPQGGDMGWVRQGQLPEELDRVLQKLEKGQISTAIRSLEGYHIFLLRDKRAVSEETLPSRAQITQDLGLQRLQRLAQRHLIDLKAAAFIERRIKP